MKNVIAAICFVLFSINVYGATKTPLPQNVVCLADYEEEDVITQEKEKRHVDINIAFSKFIKNSKDGGDGYPGCHL
jgi:hypothetical protein